MSFIDFVGLNNIVPKIIDSDSNTISFENQKSFWNFGLTVADLIIIGNSGDWEDIIGAGSTGDNRVFFHYWYKKTEASDQRLLNLKNSSAANVVYIDNVVDAIVLAIKEDDAVGHALTISDDEIVSWKDFFSSCGKMLSTPCHLREITLRELRFERKRRQLNLVRKTLSSPGQASYFLRCLADEFAGDNFFFSLAGKVEIFFVSSL